MLNSGVRSPGPGGVVGEHQQADEADGGEGGEGAGAPGAGQGGAQGGGGGGGGRKRLPGELDLNLNT